MTVRMQGVPLGSLIAVDLDDVLAQTNAAAAQWHNDAYGTQMDLSTFYYYHWWKNPLWGTAQDCLGKAQRFYDSPFYTHAPPVAGAPEGVRALRDGGYRLAIVTARDREHHAQTAAWVETHFPGCFEGIHYTGELKKLRSVWGTTRVHRVGKPELCHALGACLLIDDSADHALACATHDPPVRVLLFGEYAWNQRLSPVETDLDRMSFSERRATDSDDWWERDVFSPPEGVRRVRDWSDTVQEIRDLTP